MAIERISNRWYYRFMVGRRRHKGSTGLDAIPSNLSAAHTIEAKARIEAIEATRGIRRVQARRFNDAAADFLNVCDRQYRQKPQTAKRIRTSFASIGVHFAPLMVPDVEARHVEAYKALRIDVHKVRDITVRHDLVALGQFFKWAIARNYCRSNPVALVDLPSDADAERVYVVNPTEERAYFQHARGALRDVATVMVEQGCRPMEVLSLLKTDVDLDKGLMRIRRTPTSGKRKASERTLFLTPTTRAILGRRMAGDSPYIFPSPRPGKGHLTQLHTQHDRACRLAGRLPFNIYAWRHTFATRFGERTRDPFALMRILGVSSLKMVMKYVHPQEEQLRAAMKIYEASRIEVPAGQRPS